MKVVMLDMVNTKSQIIFKIWAYYLEIIFRKSLESKYAVHK